jgi:exopolysaccharide production protein ExoQ
MTVLTVRFRALLSGRMLCLPLLALLRFDPAKESKTSLALWVPLLWMVIFASRLPSQWIAFQGTEMGAEALELGSNPNPLDRIILSTLTLLAISILISRSFEWRAFFASNVAFLAFLSFTLLSVLWSDFPFISFKRWIRDLGGCFVILVVLSDPCPLAAVRAVFRRLCYLLIPLSILLIKYYPDIGRYFEKWTGTATNAGVTTSKNMLGALCLISGLFFFWDTVARWPDRKHDRTKRIILVNVAFIAMTLWLFNAAQSATASLCVVLGCLVIALAHSTVFQRHPTFLKMAIPASFFLYLLLGFGFGLNAKMARAVGKDPTLSDRTIIWNILLNMQAHPILGTGYDSFWVGPRVWQFAEQFALLNEAHNGYLEVYLNLGIIGVVLLGAFLAAGYRKICQRLAPFSHLASLALAIWTVLLFYGATEAAFRIGPLWLCFLLGAIAVPERTEDRVRSVAASSGPGGRWLAHGRQLEMTDRR